VIYLHGLFSPNGSNATYEGIETHNRQTLKTLSQQLGKPCRIAIPVSQKTYNSSKYGFNRVWQGSDLATVEAAARKACGGASVKIEKPAAIFGFSNGANGSIQLACSGAANYNVFAFSPDGGERKCDHLSISHNRVKHELPGVDTLIDDLAFLPGAPASQAKSVSAEVGR
jgi:hypothetical protein